MSNTALILLAGSLQSPAAASELPAPPRAVRVAGVHALHARSRVVFATAPDNPHLLVSTFAFPQRGRTRLTPEPAADPDAELQLPDPPGRLRSRFGASVFAKEPSAPSQLLDGEERKFALGELELRRAILFWPHGFEWTRTGDAAAADLGVLGGLVARFPEGADAPPSSITWFDPSGEEVDGFVDVEWRPGPHGRFVHPARMTLVSAGTVVWREEVLEVETRGRYVDSFFVPPDRRDAGRRADGGVRLYLMPERYERREPLAGEDWKVRWAAACERARVAEAELAGTGWELEPGIAFPLGEGDRPTGVSLRIAASPGAGSPPPGWEIRPGEEGASARLASAAEPVRDALERLRSEAKKRGRRPGAPYLVVRRSDGTSGLPAAQLLLPFSD